MVRTTPLVFLLTLIGCPAPAPTSTPEPTIAAPEASPSDPSQTQAASPSAPEALHGHMHEHIIHLEAARQALIKGDLPASRAAFKWLTDHEPPEGLPEGWAPHVIAMQGAARRGSGAMHLAAGADALSAAAVACGACHHANHVRPEWPDEAVPNGDPGTRENMRRHLWAADRMWEGLLQSSGEHWARGARVMIESPLTELTPDQEIPAEIADFATRVHALDVHALDAKNPEQRGALYGDYIAQCGACHRATTEPETPTP